MPTQEPRPPPDAEGLPDDLPGPNIDILGRHIQNLVVRDGYRLEQIANDAASAGLEGFDKQKFLDYTHHLDKFPDRDKYPLLKGIPNMEGLMYPETYYVPVNYDTVQIIDMILDELNNIAEHK